MSYWVKTYGYGESRAVAVDENGDIIIAGYTEDSTFVARLEGDGDVKWFRTYKASEKDIVMDLKLAPNGDIVVVGDTQGLGGEDDCDIRVLRLDSEGNVKWHRSYGGDEEDSANAVAIAPNGDVIVAGFTESFGAGNADVWVLRLDENGNVKWQKTYGGSGNDWANAVAIAPNGDIIVAGDTWSFGDMGFSVWVLRLDENGNVKWQKAYGGKDLHDDMAHAVAVAPNGDIIVAGETDSFGAGGYDVWVLRLDENGNVKWQKTYGGVDDDGHWDVNIVITPNGDVIVAGDTESFGAGKEDVWVLRLDSNGNVKWQKTYGGSGNDWAYAVALAPNGDIIVVGDTHSFDDKGSILVLRLPPDGNLPNCEFCMDSEARVLESNAKVQDTNCEVLSGIKKYRANEDEEGSAEWRIEEVSLTVRNLKTTTGSLIVKPKVLYRLHPNVEQKLLDTISVSFPTLTEGIDELVKFSVRNNFADLIALSLDLSQNDFLDVDVPVVKFPEVKRGRGISKFIQVIPKRSGQFNFMMKVYAIVDGARVTTEKVIPVKVRSRGE